MTTFAPDDVTAPTPPARRGSGERWLLVILAAGVALLLVVLGVVVGRATATGDDRAEPFDLDAFAAAWGNGEPDQIRAFYTPDAVMVPFGHMLATLGSHPVPEYWDVRGADLDREAMEHDGGTFAFVDVKQTGNMVVATGQWTFPSGMFPMSSETVIKTTEIMHLRDGKIWRQFADFEVYVNGELVDM